MKYIYILLILIVVFIGLQYKYINRTNNDIEILQAENPNKNTFENILKSKAPSIFTNVSKNFFDLQKYSLESIHTMDAKSKENLTNNIKNHFKYYNSPLTSKYTIDILIESSDSSIVITKQDSNRLLLCQLKGTKKIICFTPNQSDYLYLTKESNKKKSAIDFWKADLLDFPLLSKTKYIEITLYPGQMIYIPYQWFYAYINEEDSFSVISKSETIFSSFLKAS